MTFSFCSERRRRTCLAPVSMVSMVLWPRASRTQDPEYGREFGRCPKLLTDSSRIPSGFAAVLIWGLGDGGIEPIKAGYVLHISGDHWQRL